MQFILAFLQWIASTNASIFIKQSSWAFPAIESLHVIALSLVVGTITIVDLRLLGLASTRRRYTSLSRAVLPWTWGAFATAAATGLVMFASNPVGYFGNGDFRVKLLLILAAGCNMAIFQLFTVRTVSQWGGAARPPLSAKIAGAISLACWISVVFFGRRIGFSMAFS